MNDDIEDETGSEWLSREFYDNLAMQYPEQRDTITAVMEEATRRDPRNFMVFTKPMVLESILQGHPPATKQAHSRDFACVYTTGTGYIRILRKETDCADCDRATRRWDAFLEAVVRQRQLTPEQTDILEKVAEYCKRQRWGISRDWHERIKDASDRVGVGGAAGVIERAVHVTTTKPPTASATLADCMRYVSAVRYGVQLDVIITRAHARDVFAYEGPLFCEDPTSVSTAVALMHQLARKYEGMTFVECRQTADVERASQTLVDLHPSPFNVTEALVRLFSSSRPTGVLMCAGTAVARGLPWAAIAGNFSNIDDTARQYVATANLLNLLAVNTNGDFESHDLRMYACIVPSLSQTVLSGGEEGSDGGGRKRKRATEMERGSRETIAGCIYLTPELLENVMGLPALKNGVDHPIDRAGDRLRAITDRTPCIVNRQNPTPEQVMQIEVIQAVDAPRRPVKLLSAYTHQLHLSLVDAQNTQCLFAIPDSRWFVLHQSVRDHITTTSRLIHPGCSCDAVLGVLAGRDLDIFKALFVDVVAHEMTIASVGASQDYVPQQLFMGIHKPSIVEKVAEMRRIIARTPALAQHGYKPVRRSFVSRLPDA